MSTEQSLGQWLAAETDLEAALAAVDDAWVLAHRAKLEEARAYVAGSHLGWLEVETNAPGAEIAVDDAAARNAATISTIVTAAGAAATVGGVVLLWASRNRQSQVALLPQGWPGGCSLDVRGVW